jgi:hypothetical protein
LERYLGGGYSTPYFLKGYSMMYKVTISTEDGDHVEPCNSKFAAKEYAAKAIEYLTKHFNTQFHCQKSDYFFSLYKDKQGRVIKIERKQERNT